MTSIVLIDHTGAVPQAELISVAAALMVQACNDFGQPPPHGWGTGAVNVRVGTTPFPDEWVLGLFTHPDQPGALGYHDRTPNGLPLMKVFPTLCAKDGVSWSSCASHELCETLADPEGCRAAQAPTGQFYALEVCDAVEKDNYKDGAGVELSNFCLPCWFEPPARRRGVKLDFLGLVKAPFELRPGGYSQVWMDSGWRQLTHAEVPPRAYRELLAGRGSKRALTFNPRIS